jgi:hypothetical protein
MATDRYAVSSGDRACGYADSTTSPYSWRGSVQADDIQRIAAREVDALIDDLEPTLDSHQRRLLHQLRLAAETLGAVRAGSHLKRYSPV